MTASLSAPYALVGEKMPSQDPHQKGLPPGPPHAVVAPVVVVEAPKTLDRPNGPKVVKVPVVAKPEVPVAVQVPVQVTTVPVLPQEPVVIQLPDVPAMGN